ncbi:ribosome biogenesis GTPase Der [Dehalococcoidia bacterium]|nr:ribosome biogenesis GTPase Der [Dehalococcoidia bacterium]MCL0092075.1 ribosome biogenesis GTPase Der [Dehalococcoidia bacterium]
MTRSIIAIVGRPNVGKSTLFNRLAGERRAITEDIPGTTRDRAYATITWLGQDYTLVDTGGLEIRPDSPIGEKVKEQVEIAIEEADAIIMVVDVKDGVTIPDKEIAEMLRRSNKPVVLAVNKCDNDERTRQAFEFHEMPLDQPITISAYHGTGIEMLMERVTAGLTPSSTPPSEPDIMRIAILGHPNVGKSMLLNALVGQERSIVSELPGTTRDSIDTIVERDGRRALLIDTAGIRRRGRVDRGIEKYSVMRALRSIDRADVCLLVLDASDMLTAQDAHIAGYIRDAYKGILLVVNKWDLADELGLTKKDRVLEVERNLKFLHYAPMLFVSAKTGFGVSQILPAAAEINQARTKRLDPAELRDMVKRAIERHPPMTKRYFHLRDVIQPDVVPPTFVFAVNNPALVHFSYQRYLENSLRDAFGFTGTPLRLVFKKRLNPDKIDRD